MSKVGRPTLPPGKKKTHQIGTKVDADAFQRVEAARGRKPRAKFAREAIMEKVEKEESNA